METYTVVVRNEITGEEQFIKVQAENFTDAALMAAETPFGYWTYSRGRIG